MPNPKVRTLTIGGVTYDLQDNVSGYITGITSSDVTTALGFTPYNATNPNGYTSNTGTITSVKTTAGAHTTINVSSGAANFNVPTKTSHLTNDSGFLTSYTETDPTVPSWAKADSKPSYNFSEIGNTPTTISGYGITDAYTKTEVDNKVSAVLRYKGVKAAVSNLPTTGNVVGDVWHVTATSGEYAWDGTEWQELGTAITIPAATGSSTTGISIADHSTTTIYGVGSSTTSVTGVSGSTSVYGVKSGTNSTTTASHVASGGNGTAPTLGTAISIYGVKSGTNSTTTASHVKSGGNGSAPTLGTAFSIPNVTGNSDVTVPIRADADTTVPTAASSATTVPIKDASATACDDITAWSAGSGSLTFTMDTTDTKKLVISHTHTAPSLSYTARSIIGVQSSTTSVTGVSGSTTVRGVKTGTSSTTTASKVTLGTAFSVPNVTSAGSASNWVFEDVTVPIRADSATSIPNVTSVGSAATWTFEDVTVPIRADSATTVPTAASSATTVPIKDGTATTVVTSKTHSVTDNGHTHTI